MAKYERVDDANKVKQGETVWFVATSESGHDFLVRKAIVVAKYSKGMDLQQVLDARPSDWGMCPGQNKEVFIFTYASNYHAVFRNKNKALAFVKNVLTKHQKDAKALLDKRKATLAEFRSVCQKLTNA